MIYNIQKIQSFYQYQKGYWDYPIYAFCMEQKYPNCLNKFTNYQLNVHRRTTENKRIWRRHNVFYDVSGEYDKVICDIKDPRLYGDY